MQLTDRVKNCNGCEACIVGCKYVCVKMNEKDGIDPLEYVKIALDELEETTSVAQ